MIEALHHVRFEGRMAMAASNPHTRGRKGSLSARVSEPPGPFISWVFKQADLDVKHYRGEPLRRRLSACLRALHADTEEHARQRLEQRPDLLPVVINALLIGVTEFFRDAPVFEALQTEVLPQLSRLQRPLRIWSAGCANGAELFSVAILLAEAGLLEGSYLLGSDCRMEAINQAKAALYHSTALKNVGLSELSRHFHRVDAIWWPGSALLSHVHWEVADLSRQIEEGPWDLILWRNMAIYLQTEAAAAVWRGLASVLAPEGFLVSGKAERPPAALPVTCVKRCIYQRIEKKPHALEMLI